jgi:glycosyltransferase involved in cell wall biosynthesis
LNSRVEKEQLLVVLEPAFRETDYSQKYLPLIEKHIDADFFDIHIIGSSSGFRVLKEKYQNVYSVPFYPHSAYRIQLFVGYLVYLFYAFFLALRQSCRLKVKVVVSLGGHPYSGFIASLVAELTGKKSIIRISEPTRFIVQKRYTIGHLISKIISLQERISFTLADVIIANRDMNWYSSRLSGKQVLLSQGINLSLFNNSVHPIVESSSFPKLITVARLDRQKNIESVMEAVSSLMSRYLSIKYYIVGRGPDEEELRRMSNIVNRSHEHILFCGNVSPQLIPSYLTSADFFVLPSSIEGLPSAVLEAMACGLPVILSSTQFGCSKWFVNGENALLVKGDHESIASALEELIRDDHLRRKLIANAMRFVRKNHDSSKTRRRFVSIYQMLAN